MRRLIGIAAAGVPTSDGPGCCELALMSRSGAASHPSIANPSFSSCTQVPQCRGRNTGAISRYSCSPRMEPRSPDGPREKFIRATSLSPANPAQIARPELHVSIEHALLAIGVIFRLAQSDELAEHEIVIGADAGGWSDDVAGSFDEIEPGIAIGVVAHLRMAPHAELPARAKLRVGE